MPVTQINSILKQSKMDEKFKINMTLHGGNASIDMSLLKNIKKQVSFANPRNRPFIEKVSTQNKNHLPPPPIGKSVGHGIA